MGKASRQRRARRTRRGVSISLIFALVLLSSGGAAAIGTVGYLLWPRWPAPPVAANAPTLPVTVGGVGFNVPTAAIRFKAQRQAGAQERLDLAFQWPDLSPPEATAKPVLAPDFRPADQLFVSIVGAQGALPLADRVKTIYARYLAPTPISGPKGLGAVPFRDDSPYQGEDLFYDPEQPERFIVRCTRDNAATHGTCILERSAGAAQLTVRFPRDLLEEWSQLNDGLNMLLSSLKAG